MPSISSLIAMLLDELVLIRTLEDSCSRQKCTLLRNTPCRAGELAFKVSLQNVTSWSQPKRTSNGQSWDNWSKKNKNIPLDYSQYSHESILKKNK